MDVANRKNTLVIASGPSGRSKAGRFLLTLAAVALTGCAVNHPAVQLPPPPGPPIYWYVHDSSKEDGKITFRCIDAGSLDCADDADRRTVVLQAAKMCRDWGYDGLKNAGPDIAWTRPTMEGMKVKFQNTFRCRKPKKK